MRFDGICVHLKTMHSDDAKRKSPWGRQGIRGDKETSKWWWPGAKSKNSVKAPLTMDLQKSQKKLLHLLLQLARKIGAYPNLTQPKTNLQTTVTAPPPHKELKTVQAPPTLLKHRPHSWWISPSWRRFSPKRVSQFELPRILRWPGGLSQPQPRWPDWRVAKSSLNLPLLDIPLSRSFMQLSSAMPRASFSQTASDWHSLT